MIGTNDGERVMLGLRAIVARAGSPDAKRRGVAGGWPVIGRRRPLVAGSNDETEHQERAVHKLPIGDRIAALSRQRR